MPTGSSRFPAFSRGMLTLSTRFPVFIAGTKHEVAIAGQKTTATANIPVRLGTRFVGGRLAIRALDTNSGVVAIGFDGTSVSMANGYRLSAKESIILDYVGSMENLWLVSGTGGEGVSWMILDIP